MSMSINDRASKRNVVVDTLPSFLTYLHILPSSSYKKRAIDNEVRYTASLTPMESITTVRADDT